MSLLRDEILEQPRVLKRLFDEQETVTAEIARAIRSRNVSCVVMAARGTSDNASRYAQYLFGALNRLRVSLAMPSLFSIYHAPPRLDDAIVIGVSQSGQSPDIISVIEEGNRQGALTLAVTNAPDSPLADASDFVLSICAGSEQAVAATKSYTAQLGALALLAVQLADDRERLGLLRSVPDAVARALEMEEWVARCAQRYTYASESVVLGRGFNYCTAFEIALKLKEQTYMVVEPYSSADFRHGPVAIVDRGFPAVVIAPAGAVFPDMVALTLELAGREAELIMISDREEALELAAIPLRLPVTLPEWLSPFTCIVPGQLLALYITQAKGYDVDNPRGLKKVTVTR